MRYSPMCRFALCSSVLHQLYSCSPFSFERFGSDSSKELYSWIGPTTSPYYDERGLTCLTSDGWAIGSGPSVVMVKKACSEDADPGWVCLPVQAELADGGIRPRRVEDDPHRPREVTFNGTATQATLKRDNGYPADIQQSTALRTGRECAYWPTVTTGPVQSMLEMSAVDMSHGTLR